MPTYVITELGEEIYNSPDSPGNNLDRWEKEALGFAYNHTLFKFWDFFDYYRSAGSTNRALQSYLLALEALVRKGYIDLLG